MGAESDEETELALADLRDETDAPKQQHYAERPNEGADMQADEDKFMEQGVPQLHEQAKEDGFGGQMGMSEGKGVAGVASAEEQGARAWAWKRKGVSPSM